MHSFATAPIPVIPCPGSAPHRLLPRFLLLGVGVLAGNLAACSEDKSKVGTDSPAAAPAPASVPSTGGAPIAAPAPVPAPAPVTDPSAALANAMSTPARAAETFYRTKMELKIDGLPQEWQLASLTGTITPELNRVFDKASFTQAAFIINKKEGKPPWVEGDLFSSLFEGVTTFKTGTASITGTTAEVPLALTHTANGQTTQWTDHLILKPVNGGGWLVDDLRYGGTWDAATRGTLRQRLTPPNP
ncbi:MAG: hypothetical protein V4675_19290 [Verrucomicrobiota bacterium]